VNGSDQGKKLIKQSSGCHIFSNSCCSVKLWS
jgi:hypothetical protein